MLLFLFTVPKTVVDDDEEEEGVLRLMTILHDTKKMKLGYKENVLFTFD